jgi:hypothetical protein
MPPDIHSSCAIDLAPVTARTPSVQRETYDDATTTFCPLDEPTFVEG